MLVVRNEYLDTFLLGKIGWEIPETSLLIWWDCQEGKGNNGKAYYS